MGKPAARVGDMHTCPMVTPAVPPVPHVGGPLLPPGVLTVLIGNMPAATIGNMCVCIGPPSSVIRGSTGVFIGGRPAARMGDNTAHGGVIVSGFPTVLIGEVGGGGGAISPDAAAAASGGGGGGWLDALQLGLDIVGLVPGLGEIADGANALIYVARGDYANAALSVAAMIPIGGQAATAAKLGIKGAKEVAEEGVEKVVKEGIEEVADIPAWKGPTDYSNINTDRFKIDEGKNFSKAQKKAIYDANIKHNDGVLRSDLDGSPLEKPAKSQKGVKPSQTEAQVDHVKPKSKGGTNDPSENAQILSREQNRDKSDKWDE